MYKKLSCCHAVMLFALCPMLFASCSKGPAATNSSDIVASVGDINITAGELSEAAKDQLMRVDQEVYRIKRGVLDDMIEEKLIDAAASKAGKSKDGYLKENVDDKVSKPTDEEIKNFYESRKAQMGGKKFEEAKDMIKSFLTQGQTQNLRRQLLSSLQSSANIKINLEPPRVKIDVGDQPAMGPKGAPVTLVEFTDYQCPFCGRVRETINKIMDEYKDKVRYVLFDFPLSFHQNAQKAHEAAYCAGDQGKYWEYNKKLWGNQGALEAAKLKKYAQDIKLNTGKFNKCLDEGKYAKRVQENVQNGANAGVSGTPAFFVNGIMLSGARPYSDFKDLIEQELKK